MLLWPNTQNSQPDRSTQSKEQTHQVFFWENTVQTQAITHTHMHVHSPLRTHARTPYPYEHLRETVPPADHLEIDEVTTGIDPHATMHGPDIRCGDHHVHKIRVQSLRPYWLSLNVNFDFSFISHKNIYLVVFYLDFLLILSSNSINSKTKTQRQVIPWLIIQKSKVAFKANQTGPKSLS